MSVSANSGFRFELYFSTYIREVERKTYFHDNRYSPILASHFANSSNQDLVCEHLSSKPSTL